jgi:hypothetical protein
VKEDISTLKQNIKIQFREIEESMKKQNIKINNMIMKLDNSFIIVKNNRIRRFHELIHFIKVFIIDSDLKHFEWKFHFNVSKSLKDCYVLRQQTKDIFDMHSKFTSDAQSQYNLFYEMKRLYRFDEHY